MSELATAYVSLIPSLRGAGKTIERELDGGDVRQAADRAGRNIGDRVSKETGSRLGAGVKAALAGAFATVSVGAIVSFANDAVASFSELEDSTAAAGVVFGKNMSAIVAQSKTAATELGLNQQQVINAANTFGTYGKSAGLAGKDLANFATEQTALAADLASFKGTSPEQAIEAVGAALRGEMEPIRAYGVLLDDATLRNRALKLGLIETTKDALTPQQKVLAAQKEILAQTSDAQGDFARTSESTANVAKTLTANSENLRAQIGEKLAPAFTAVRRVANGVLAGFSASIDPAITRTKELVGWVRQNQAWLGPLAAAVLAVATAFVTFRVAMATWSVVTRIAAAAQLALNAAIASNPIGIVILAVAALVGALIYLYQNNEAVRRVIDAVWTGIKTAIGAVATWFTDVAWPALQTAITAVGNAFSWLYQNIILPVWNGIKTAIQIAWAVIRVIFVTWATAFSLLWQGVSFVWSKTGAPLFKAISRAAGAMWAWVRDTVLKPLRAAWAAVWNAAVGIVTSVVSPLWEAVKTGFRVLWVYLRDRVFEPIGAAWTAIGNGFGWVNDNVISPAWEGVQSLLSAGWGWIKDHVFTPMGDGVEAIGEVFEATKEIISTAWKGIKAAAAGPVNFVIETVYTKGIKATWDKIADAVGLDLKLPTVNPIKYATGGVLPGYTPGRDVHDFFSPTAGRLSLSGGEAIMRPEFTRAVGGPAGVARLNMAARSGQAFADGGVWGWAGDLWDSAKAKAASVAKVLRDPAGALAGMITDPMKRTLGSIGGGTVSKIVSELPKQVVGSLIEKAKGLVGALAPSGGGKAGPAMGWQNMWRLVSAAFPGASLTSAFRPGAITAVGTPSFHGQGRAIDVSPSMAIFNWIAKNFPNSTELIYSPANGRQLYMGRQTLFGEPTRGDHWDHVHWAMKNGGVLPKLYDQGGWLPSGGLGVNATGKPEAVLTPAESRALKSGLNQRPIENHFHTTRVSVRDVLYAQRLDELQSVVGVAE